MSEKKIPVRVRFAPSPTGHMHLGSARTALYDYLIAKKTGGKFILRIEDTDRKRFIEGAEEELIQGMRWLGIESDEGPDKGGDYGPYRQSERKEIYLEHGRKLIEMGMAYYCFCSLERLEKVKQQKQANKELPHYDGTCRVIDPGLAEQRVKNGESHVIRFKSPQTGTTIINDFIRGEIIIENCNLDDFILVKSDGWALYHLAATVDDHLMKISHVIRGSEWLSTFPLHALIHRAFGWEEPVWVHLSVFLKPSGKGKMSKRDAADFIKDGHSIFIKDLQGLGYTPEGVVNWIALMGWSYDGHTEFFTMNDLVEKFTLDRLNPSPAAINFTKLDYFNKEHIKALSSTELAKRIKPFFIEKGYIVDDSTLEKIAPIIKERITTLDDAVDISSFFFKSDFLYDVERLKIEGLPVSETIRIGDEIIKLLSGFTDMSIGPVELAMQSLLEKLQQTPKQVFTFMREAISAQRVTPPLFESMAILGKDEVIRRITKAIDYLKSLP
jgi:glutamyl-tRNA synthetase